MKTDIQLTNVYDLWSEHRASGQSGDQTTTAAIPRDDLDACRADHPSDNDYSQPGPRLVDFCLEAIFHNRHA
jgi:hypothetical protein